MTNGDIIRNMTDEELAEFLKEYVNSPCGFCLICGDESCSKETLRWLKAEN